MFTQKSLALAVACVVVSLVGEHAEKHDQNTDILYDLGDLSNLRDSLPLIV